MVDFTQNFPGFLIAFIPALINLGLLVYMLAELPGTRLVHLFAVLTFCAALWQIDDALARVITNEPSIIFWDSLLSVGWILLGPLCLHFSLLYSRLVSNPNSFRLIALLYIPAFVFMSTYQAHLYPHDFHYRAFWGWVNYHENATLDVIMLYWISVLVLVSCVILFRFARKMRGDALLRQQSVIIAAGIAIPTVTGVVCQVLIPTLLLRPAIPLTSSSLTFLSIATVLALRRYRLFTIMELASNEILLEELPVGVMSISDTGHITYINKCGRTMFGLQQDPGKLEELLRYASPQNAAGFREAFDRALKGEQTDDISSAIERADKTLSVTISSGPISNNSRIRGALLCIRDVTALKTTESTLQQKNRELQQKNASLEEFAFVASHDLSEPLRKIITFSGLIQKAEGDKLEGRSRDYFRKVISTAESMQDMIEDILALSVIREEQEFELFSLQEIVDDAVREQKESIDRAGAVVRYGTLPHASIHPKQFRLLFCNLIANSLKFARSGVSPRISVSCEGLSAGEREALKLPGNRSYLKIVYKDNGIGFENEYADKIFQMFQRLHGKGAYEGNGIGLSICRKIVEHHRGLITARGEPGKGATFIIIIPK